MRLFAKAKEAPPPAASLAKLREEVENTTRRAEYMEKKATAQLEEARRLLGKNRRAATMCLKRKHMYEGVAERLSGMALSMESQILAIEGAISAGQAIQAIREGTEAMRRAQQGMTVDNVDDLMEEMQEQLEVSKTLSEAMAQPLGQAFDEDELEEELRALEQESLNDQLVNQPALAMPNAPTDHLPQLVAASRTPAAAAAARSQEDDDVAALRASMALAM